jgi:hypothetical protein
LVLSSLLESLDPLVDLGLFLVTFTNAVFLIHNKASLAIKYHEYPTGIPNNVRRVLAIHPRMPVQSEPMLARATATLEKRFWKAGMLLSRKTALPFLWHVSP